MKEANDILEDSSLKLAVQLDDTRKQARDLETAFDITTDSSLDVAKAEDTLVKSINAKNKATERATDHIDSVAYAQRTTASVESDYQKALERRTELENKISKQGEIVRYSEQATGGSPAPATETPAPSSPEAPKPKPVDVDAELQSFLKSKGLTSRGDYENKKKADDKAREENKGFIRKSADYIGSKTVATIKDATQGAFSHMASGLESSLGLREIPLYGAAKAATGKVVGGATKFAKFAGGQAIEKIKESRFEKMKEKATKEFHSSRENTTGEEVQQEEQGKRDQQEQRQERGENKKERGENDKRHKSLITVLKDIGKAILIGGIMKMFSGLVGALGSLGGGLFSRFGLLIATLGSLAGKIASSMSSLLGKMFPKVFPKFGKSKTPDIDVDGKKKPSADIDADGKKKIEAEGKTKPSTDVDIDGKKKPPMEPGKTPDVDMKPGRAAGEVVEEAGGKAGQKAAQAGTSGFFKKVASKAGLKTAAAVVGRVATKFIPFVGTALLLNDLYDIADYVTDGKVSEMVSNAGTALKEKLSPVANIQAGTAPASAQMEVTEENVKAAEAAKKERDRQRDATAAQARMAVSSNVNNNNTSVYNSGSPFAPDHIYANASAYGVQKR